MFDKPQAGSLRVCLALAIIAGAATTTKAVDDLWPQDQRPDRVRISLRPETAEPVDAIMTRAIAGVLLDLDGASIDELKSCVVDSEASALERAQTPECYLQMNAPASARTLVVWAAGTDAYLVTDIDVSDGAPAIVFDGKRFRTLLGRGEQYRGGFEANDVALPLAATTKLDPPYVSSPIYLDEPTVTYRVYREQQAEIRSVDRDLREAEFFLRLPKGYDPQRPAGLLVWCSPMPGGGVPPMFEKALDELYMVGVATANADNTRLFHERCQLMLDSATNAQRRAHIDPRRVYLTGMSGGGRMTSVMCICFPDVFAGGIPIVGFSSYSTLRTTFAKCSKPLDDRLAMAREMPIALMGGPPDFNYVEMRERMYRLEQDGFTGLRFFDYPDMAHVMPTPDRFLDALSYVDERYAAIREAEEQGASRLLTSYLESHGDKTPVSEAQREALVEIMRVGPWTDAAWRAYRRLQTGS